MKYATKGNIALAETPTVFEKTDYGATLKQKILSYMESIESFIVVGTVYDCVKDEHQRIENLVYDDGTFRWNTQEIYHVKEYNASVTDEFMEMILSSGK